MLKFPALTQSISKHFKLHPSRQKTLISLIFGSISSSNVHHQSLSRYVGSPNPKAALRKVERFFVRRNYPQRTRLKPLSIFLTLKESLTYALIEPTGNSAKKASIIWC
jgi:hypothetical protein